MAGDSDGAGIGGGQISRSDRSRDGQCIAHPVSDSAVSGEGLASGEGIAGSLGSHIKGALGGERAEIDIRAGKTTSRS